MNDLYAAVDAIVAEDGISVTVACESLEICRSAYYAWRSAPRTVSEEADMELLPIVKMIFHRHKRRYGARRVAEELRDLGYCCGVRRASKLLKTLGLQAIQPKSYKPRTTESSHRLGYSPNLLLQLEEPDGVDQLWVGDITYVPIFGGRFLYLALMMDRYSRCIIGWRIRDDMTESLVIDTLKQSIRRRQPAPGLIHHTDRGGQYAGKSYRNILRRAHCKQSMSRAGDCYDNAFMESCFGTIKTELEMTEYQNKQEAVKEIKSYVAYYNHDRKHSSLGYLTPTQFESLIAET